MLKIWLFSFSILILILPQMKVFAQSSNYLDDEVDLWNNNRQQPRQSSDFESYYTPTEDFPGSKAYITVDELQAIKNKDRLPVNTLPDAPPVFAEQKKLLVSPELAAAYTLANITYGIATGVFIGGVIAIIQNGTPRESLRSIGLGIVLGGVLGYYISNLFRPQLDVEVQKYPERYRVPTTTNRLPLSLDTNTGKRSENNTGFAINIYDGKF